jgi:hypothetical protein
MQYRRANSYSFDDKGVKTLQQLHFKDLTAALIQCLEITVM